MVQDVDSEELIGQVYFSALVCALNIFQNIYILNIRVLKYKKPQINGLDQTLHLSTQLETDLHFSS